MLNTRFRPVFRDSELEHQIKLEVSAVDVGLGVQVQCNCMWSAPRNPVDLDDAWTLFWEHLL